MSQHKQLEHIFRHEYGLLVASLLRRVGVQNLESVEDAVQYAMMQALDFWSRDKLPEKPSAWLYQVAFRQLLSEFRLTKRRNSLLTDELMLNETEAHPAYEVPLPGEMGDSLLRMLFVACDEAIPVESQLVFTLKSLCGFNVKEISLRLFITEANVYKRYGRAKQHLKTQPLELDPLTSYELKTRLPMVQRVLYLLFTEGYLSSQADAAIRLDLCEEAIRLTFLLSESTLGNTPETSALLALMYLHLSRMNSRQDDSGSLLLLEQQKRDQWNYEHLNSGLAYLEKSATGENLSRYHVEASIAAEHCLAPSFEETRWNKIIEGYEILEKISPSAMHILNRAVATAEWKSPCAGLAVLESKEIPSWLTRSYHWHAVQADLQYRCGDTASARTSAEDAILSAPTEDIKKLLLSRFTQYGFPESKQNPI